VLSGVLLATAIALILLTKQLIPDLSIRPEYQLSAAQITITTPPRWIPADIRQQICEQAAQAQPLSLLDDSLSERIAAAFHTHPWVLRVIRVQKMWPARVHVELEWRRPVAMVNGIDGFYPVDINGVLLPGRDFAPADLKRFPVIENISSVPLGRVGEAWGDPVVNEAAVLAATLLEAESDQDSWWQRFSLAAIVAPSERLWMPRSMIWNSASAPPEDPPSSGDAAPEVSIPQNSAPAANWNESSNSTNASAPSTTTTAHGSLISAPGRECAGHCWLPIPTANLRLAEPRQIRSHDATKTTSRSPAERSPIPRCQLPGHRFNPAEEDKTGTSEKHQTAVD
jgi:hypothetical protein